MDYTDEKDKKEEQKDNTLLSELGNNILDLAGAAMSSGKNTQSDVSEDGVFDNISETIICLKSSIVENTGEILEKSIDITGSDVDGIANAVGDIVSNIDL